MSVPVPDAALEGELLVPEGPDGAVLFAFGSSDARLDPTNQAVAMFLRDEARCATLMLDLLSTEEGDVDRSTGQLRFDLPLLAGRLVHAIEWLRRDARTADLRAGCLCSETVTAAALIASADHPDIFTGIVSHAGRPDLAGPTTLARVRAPTLLIVGGRDRLVLDLNTRARRHLRVPSGLEVILDAGHLFDGPNAWPEVARRAALWFQASYRTPAS